MSDGNPDTAAARPPYVDMGLAPRYLPHIDQTAILAMGLAPLAQPWIDVDTDLAAWRTHKLYQRQQRGSGVYRVAESALAASCEVAGLIAALPEVDLPACLPDDPEALWQASLAVPDDLLIMQPGEQGYRLTAASLCSPSHWRLPDKFERPIDRIHDPVPGIHGTLSPRIQRFFERLRSDTPVQRFNWSLQAGWELLAWPREHPQPVSAETPLYYRVERQTLRRLPQSGALLFTIRVYLHPIEQLGAVDGAIEGLLAAVDSTPAALAAYKGFPRLAPALARLRGDAIRLQDSGVPSGTSQEKP